MTGTIVDRLRDARRVHFDTVTLIYLIERHPSYGPLAREAFALVDAGRCVGLSSFVTLLEVLVKPFRDQRADLVREYRDLLTGSRGFFLFPLDREIAEQGARIRAQFGFRTPDAIQLATAVTHGADVFLTNDRKLKNFEDVQVVVLDDFSPHAGIGAEAMR